MRRCEGTSLSLGTSSAIFNSNNQLTLYIRAREHELLYVLRKLLDLRLWSGSLWAAMSDNPSEYCIGQPGDIRDINGTATTLTYFVLCRNRRLLEP